MSTLSVTIFHIKNQDYHINIFYSAPTTIYQAMAA